MASEVVWLMERDIAMAEVMEREGRPVDPDRLGLMSRRALEDELQGAAQPCLEDGRAGYYPADVVLIVGRRLDAFRRFEM